MQQVKAGVKAIYLSGWQVAADNNGYAAMYPDQSLYPVDSVPKVVERINNTFRRADEIQHSKGIDAGDAGYIDNFAPIVADAEAGFGGVLNAFELMKNMIAAGAAGVHFEDQLASVNSRITLADDARRLQIDADLAAYAASIDSRKRQLDASLSVVSDKLATATDTLAAKDLLSASLDAQIADQRRTLDQLKSDAAAVIAKLTAAAGGV